MIEKKVDEAGRVAVYMKVKLELYKAWKERATKKNMTMTELFTTWLERFVPKKSDIRREREREIHRR